MRITKRNIVLVGVVALAGWVANGAYAQTELFVYPEKGQSQEQTDKDKFECYNWAKEQSGFDPMQAPTASSPPPEQTTSGGVVRGAAGGAALGAIGGAIAGDAGKGAAIGAGTGAAMGGMRRRSSERQNQQEQ